MIRVQGSIGLAAKHSVVATIDRGTVDGVQSGYVFSVNQKGQEIRDPKPMKTDPSNGAYRQHHGI